MKHPIELSRLSRASSGSLDRLTPLFTAPTWPMTEPSLSSIRTERPPSQEKGFRETEERNINDMARGKRTIGTLDQYVKANRQASRDEEIREHGRQVSFRTTMTRSRKKYDRSREIRAVKREILLF